MAGSAAASLDDMLAAYTKPPPGGDDAASPLDSALGAYLKPAPAPVAPEDTISPFAAEGIELSSLPKIGGALNDAARSANAYIANATAPLRPPGDTPLGPNATAADIPADSPAGQLRMGVTLAAPLQDIDPKATFEALSARRNELLADGKDPKSDPVYRDLVRNQALEIAQNNQRGAMFLVPGGALEGGVAGIVSRGANRLVDAALPENRLSGAAGTPLAPPAVAPPAGPAAAQAVQDAAPVVPAINKLAAPGTTPAQQLADAVAASNVAPAPPRPWPAADYPRYDENGNRIKAGPQPAADTTVAPAAGAAPTPPAGPPVPRDLGAAASAASDTAMAPQDAARYQASAEGRKLLETQMPGVADTTAYVPGVNATTAEIEQTVNASREAKLANIASPDLSQTDREIAEANSEHRKNYFESASGDPVSTGILRDDRSEQATADLSAAFSGEKAPADTAPISSAIRDTLDTPRGRQNDDLQGYLNPLLKRLENADGVPKITDPEELYGFREQVAKMLSKASQRKDPGLEHVSGQIGDLLPVIDKQIEAAAPGYRQYMDNYAAASRKIDEQTVLQDHLPKLFDAQNHMTYNKVQTMMRQIVDARSARGLNPYKSITDDTMATLWNLRDDLRRSASARELARTPGSDTAQNLFDLAKDAGRGAVRLGIHTAANAAFPVVGSLVVNAGDRLLAARSANRLQAEATARGHKNLQPNRLVPRED